MSNAPPNREAMDRDDIDVELRDIDERILDLLENHPCTRQYLADELGVTGEYIGQRVDILMKHVGIVERIHDGFYELAGWRDEYECEQIGGENR